MITLYGRYETAFNTNGLGILEVYDDVVEEELNGIFKLTFKYPKFARLGSRIVNGMTLRSDTPDGLEPFRIWSIIDRDDVLEVTAHHISFDLYFDFIEDKNLVGLGGQSALGRLLEDTPFTGLSDVTTVDSVRVIRKSVQQAIFSDDDNSFLTRWGGEFKRSGFTLTAMNRIGRTYAQNPVNIRYGKDLVSYEATEDESTYYNRVMPIGFDGLLLPEKYVDRTGIDLNDIRVTTVDYNDIKVIADPANPQEDEVTAAVAYQMMRDRVAAEFAAGAYDAKVNYRVEFVDLSSTVEYENRAVLVTRYIGDEVKVVRYEGKLTIAEIIAGTRPTEIMARIISYQYCPTTKEYLSMELGNFEDKPMNIISRLDYVARTVTELSEKQITEQHVTDLLTSALGGYVQEYNGEMFIMDTADPMTATKVWRWNLNGLGYSGTGINGPYTTAITMDGTIIGTFIAADTISTNQISSTASIRLVANTTVEINELGLTIDDGVSPTISRHDGGATTYLDRNTGNPFASYAAGQADVDVLNARKIYSPHVANKVGDAVSVYVDTAPTGDGSGRDASNKASSLDRALQTALDGAMVIEEDVTVYVSGKVTEALRLKGFSGGGRIIVQGRGQITGQISVINCSCRVDFNLIDVVRPDISATAALISVVNSCDVRVNGCRLDGYSVGTGIGAYYGGGVYVTDCDIVKCEYAYDASVNARIAQVGCRGANNLYVGNSALGSNIVLSGTRPIATNIKRETAGGVITDASSTGQTSTFASTPATWKTVSKTFAGKLSTANHATGYVWKTGTWTQGTWDGTAQRGYADFGSSIKDWLDSAGGYQNMSSVIIKAHRNATSGGGSVSLKIALPSAQSLPAVARGGTSQASLVSGLVAAMTSGALKLSSSTTATADYAGFNKIEIIVTADKKA